MPDVHKILCIRSDRIGEFLLTLPAIQLLKIHYPRARLFLLAQNQNLELIKGASFIDENLPLEILPSTMVGLARTLRKSKYDLVVIFNPKKIFHVAAFLARIPIRVGYERKWGLLLNRRIPDTKHIDQWHEIEQNIRLASLVCPSSQVPRLELPWNERAEILSFLNREKIADKAPFVVIHPFTSNPKKEMPFSFWKKLVEAITSKGRPVVLIGRGEEYQKSGFATRQNPGVINLSGKLTLRETGNLLKFFCGYYVGLDSGPFHMASLLGIPLTVLFRMPEMIPRWGPYPARKTADVILYENHSEKTTIDRICNRIFK